MSRWARTVCLAFIPAFLLSVTLVGCSGKKDEGGGDEKKTSQKKKKKGKDKDVAGGMTPVKAEGAGTIAGKITVEGDPPVEELNKELLAQIEKQADKNVCKGGDHDQYRWVVGKDKALKNVFVWIRPLNENEFFDVEQLVKEGKGFPKKVTVDQPHCAFIPHAFVLFPRYLNPKAPTRDYEEAPVTGQVLEVRNSAPIQHNTSVSSDDRDALASKSETIGAGKEIPDMIKSARIKPSYDAPIKLGCNIHPWMRAYGWAFPHPFAAVTNDKGEFKIENVPAGTKVRIVVWHEEAGWVNGKEGEVVEVKKDGTTTKNFTVKYKK